MTTRSLLANLFVYYLSYVRFGQTLELHNFLVAFHKAFHLETIPDMSYLLEAVAVCDWREEGLQDLIQVTRGKLGVLCCVSDILFVGCAIHCSVLFLLYF